MIGRLWRLRNKSNDTVVGVPPTRTIGRSAKSTHRTVRTTHCVESDRWLGSRRLNRQNNLSQGAKFTDLALGLLADPYAPYLHASNETRRRLNQAIFSRLYIHDESVTDRAVTTPMADLLAADAGYQTPPPPTPNGPPMPPTARSPHKRKTPSLLTTPND